MLLQKPSDALETARIAIHYAAHDSVQLRHVTNRPIFVDMPALLDDMLEQFLVERDVFGQRVSDRDFLVRHMNEDLRPEALELLLVEESLYLRIPGIRSIYNVLLFEFSPVP